MSFAVQLMSTTSANNEVNKNVTTISTLNGNLRKGSSIINPVIDIDVDNGSGVFTSVNYFFVPVFHRYYFMTDIINDNFRLWTIHGHVDVLMTYKSGIKGISAIVARSSNVYNMYLDDGWFSSYQNSYVIRRRFSVQNPFETQEFVLVALGG